MTEVGIQFAAVPDLAVTAIRIRGCPLVGQWLKFYDPDARRGIGECEWTDDLEDALRFADFDAAKTFWEQQSTVDPIHLEKRTGTDGLEMVEVENRPLTVISITVSPLP